MLPLVRHHHQPALLLVRILTSLVILGFVLAPGAMAFDARSAEQLLIGAGEVVADDLYLAGQTITIDGTVRGDVVAAGQTITVNGTIDGALIAAGQTIIVNGIVRDTARLAAQAVVLEPRAAVGRDLVAFAASVENRARSTVGRDVTLGAGQALLAGSIGRNVLGGMGSLAIHGAIGGDVNVTIGGEGGTAQPFMGPPPAVAIPSVPAGLTVADTARIEGRLAYEAPRSYPIAGQVGQGTTWTPLVGETPAEPTLAQTIADNVRRLIALAVIGLVLAWLAPRWMDRLATTIEHRPLPSLGWGFVAAIAATGAVIGIAVVTAVLTGAFAAATLGILAGIVFVLGLLGDLAFVIGLTIFAAFVAQVIVSYLVGRTLLARIYPAGLERRDVPLLVGLPVFVIVTALPGVGGLVALLTAIATLGAVWIRVRDDRLASPQAQPVAPEAPPMAA